MKIAIISGASAGLGKKLLEKAIPAFPDIEEYWLISRSLDKLKEVSSAYPTKSFKLMPLDLCSQDSFKTLSDELESTKHEVGLLINNAGCGYLNNVGDGPLDEQLNMVDLHTEKGITQHQDHTTRKPVDHISTQRTDYQRSHRIARKDHSDCIFVGVKCLAQICGQQWREQHKREENHKVRQPYFYIVAVP